MFELFAQGDRSLARSEGGSGIGLTLVKKLVEMHGGTRRGHERGARQGERVHGPAPAGEAAPTRRPAPTTAAPVAGRGEARVLVVDDNVDTARGMARLLKLLGHEVARRPRRPDGHRGGQRAPARVRPPRHRPARHGRLRGRRTLRQEECCRDAVIIAVSGYGQDEDRRRTARGGLRPPPGQAGRPRRPRLPVERRSMIRGPMTSKVGRIALPGS